MVLTPKIYPSCRRQTRIRTETEGIPEFHNAVEMRTRQKCAMLLSTLSYYFGHMALTVHPEQADRRARTMVSIYKYVCHFAFSADSMPSQIWCKWTSRHTHTNSYESHSSSLRWTGRTKKRRKYLCTRQAAAGRPTFLTATWFYSLYYVIAFSHVMLTRPAININFVTAYERSHIFIRERVIRLIGNGKINAGTSTVQRKPTHCHRSGHSRLHKSITTTHPNR